MTNGFKEQFKEHLSKFNTYPYLFIGSGLSIRYFNLDSWINLLKSICNELKLNDYSYYASSSYQDFTKIADMMAKDLKEKWWKNEEFSESRKLFKDFTINDESPLKYEICNYIKNKSNITSELNNLKEINLLKKSNIDGIITTNWDNFIEENLFEHFNCYIGQEELIFSDSFDIGIIYKIHGGIKKPNSLVLTKTDYDNFENSYPYLAAKLLTIFVEHPIIFLGYSLQDKNIQGILKSIINCLSNEKISKLQDRLIFCEWKENESPTFQDSTILIDGTTLPIKLIKTSSFETIFSVLSELKRKIPINVLKNMKKMVYEFVKSSEPKSRIFVTDDLDKIENQNNVEFVYGVGIMDKLSKVGIKKLSVDDLIKDFLFDENKYNCKDICFEWFPEQKSVKYIPFFKYLKNADLINSNKKLKANNKFTTDFINKISKINLEYFTPNDSYMKKKEEIIKKYENLDQIFNDENLKDINKYIYPLLLEPKKIDLDLLKKFLKNNYKRNDSHYRKLVCYYDYIKYIGFEDD